VTPQSHDDEPVGFGSQEKEHSASTTLGGVRSEVGVLSHEY
jgi:hypothetical protein